MMLPAGGEPGTPETYRRQGNLKVVVVADHASTKAIVLEVPSSTDAIE